MEQFSFQYPIWLVGFCLLLAIGISFLVYYRSSALNDKPPAYRLALALLRSSGFFILLLLLLNPIFKTRQKEIKKPLLVYAQDVSESMRLKASKQLEPFLISRDNFLSELQEKFDIVYVEVGNDCSIQKTDTFDATATDLSSVFDLCIEQLDMQQLKTVVLASDGIYNKGRSPLYHSLLQQVPVQTILFGDTSQKKDIAVQNVFFNEIIYAGDQCAIQLDFSAYNLLNEKIDLKLEEYSNNQWKEVESQSYTSTKYYSFDTRNFTIQTKQPGIFRYRFRIPGFQGEENVVNNAREFFIEVIDSKKKILLLALAPHPDIAAIKSALMSSKNYDVVTKFYPETPSEYKSYEATILHQLPGLNVNYVKQIQDLTSLNIPLIFICGSQSDILQFNKIQDMITINGNNGGINESTAILSTDFKPFELTDKVQELSKTLPPLNAPFGSYESKPGSVALFKQKIGKVETSYPLWLVSEKMGKRSACIAADGLWKWRLAEFASYGNTTITDELLLKTIQFVSLKEDKRRFRVIQDKKIINSGDPIIFNAELYNDNYERINTPDVQITITDSKNAAYNFTFSKIANYYQLNAGTLGPGDYKFLSSVNWNNKEYKADGRFSITDLKLESSNTVANHDLLKNIAMRSGGQSYNPESLELLKNQLLNFDQAKPTIYYHIDFLPLINLKWIFAILCLLFGAEWFLRRYWGSY